MIKKKSVSIIGSGPSALMLAAQLAEEKFEVTIYERNFAPGRKFLVAGDGGFNLTHAEPADQFFTRYTPVSFLRNAFTSFSNNDLIDWLRSIGIPTYVGSSGRVFPLKPIKPIEVLNAILNILAAKNVTFKNQQLWQGWDNNTLSFSTKEQGVISVHTDIVVFALGGGSWKKTGSDGSWLRYFSAKGIDTIPFQASNCAVKIRWPQPVLKELEGRALKNITIKCSGNEKKGEVVITAFGMEGGAIYALSPQVREQLQQNGHAVIFLDLKPDFTPDELLTKLLTNRGKKSLTKRLEDQVKLSHIQLQLIKNSTNKEEFFNEAILAEKIKNLPLEITDMAAVDEAISTVGGIALHEVDTNFQLKKLPATYAIGEMLDWDAPTGGYLLQACFSMGHYLAKHLNNSGALALTENK